MYRRILVPLDGSAAAEHALTLAAGLAHRAGAELRLVHVVNFAVSLPCDPNDPDDWRGCARSDAEKYLQGIADELELNPKARVSIAVRDGDPVRSIHEEADGWNADLIVMTTHGRGTIQRAWMGSVADTLVRESMLPLLLVRAQEEPALVRGTRGIHHILVPLDQSERSKEVLVPATALARSEGARMTLLHVVDRWVAPIRALAHAHHTADLRQATVRECTTAAEDYLSEAALAIDSEIRDVTTEVLVADDSEAGEILKYARAYAVDLIALATHGRSGLKRVVLGSVADKILRGADVPVLIYRPGS